jgi:hypothetical protein
MHFALHILLGVYFTTRGSNEMHFKVLARDKESITPGSLRCAHAAELFIKRERVMCARTQHTTERGYLDLVRI